MIIITLLQTIINLSDRTLIIIHIIITCMSTTECIKAIICNLQAACKVVTIITTITTTEIMGLLLIMTKECQTPKIVQILIEMVSYGNSFNFKSFVLQDCFNLIDGKNNIYQSYSKQHTSRYENYNESDRYPSNNLYNNNSIFNNNPGNNYYNNSNNNYPPNDYEMRDGKYSKNSQSRSENVNQQSQEKNYPDGYSNNMAANNSSNSNNFANNNNNNKHPSRSNSRSKSSSNLSRSR